MDLTTALEIVSQPLIVTGRSSPEIARQVGAQRGLTAPVRPVPALDDHIEVRQLDALRGLAVATRMGYGDSLLEAYSHWALLRYMGAFGTFKQGPDLYLALSDAGERVAGNQRRVMSEDLGIALGLKVAEEWIRDRAGAPTDAPLWVADVDLLEWTCGVYGIGGPGPRPDYVVMTAPAADAETVHVGLVECKGTRIRVRVGQRLVDGCTQIGPSVAQAELPGLVISSVFSGDHVEFSALEVSTTPDPAPLPAEHPLVQAVREASWAGLAEYAGNVGAAQRWFGRSFLQMNLADREYRSPRTRVRRAALDGADVVGVVNRLVLPGGVAEVVLGVDPAVDDQLERGGPEAIVAAQRGAAARRGGRNPQRGASRGADGSVLLVTPGGDVSDGGDADVPAGG